MASDFDATVQTRILAIGDSKTWLPGNTWPTTLAASLTTATSPTQQWSMDDVGVGASTASYWHSNIDSILAGQPDNHTTILLNLGVNDFIGGTQAAWIADMEYVLDAVHARWPQALVYIMYPWKQGFDSTATAYHGWIDTIIAARSFSRAGPDEAVWLKSSDNGATNTTDGIHYSTAGQTACAAAWKTNLGY